MDSLGPRNGGSDFGAAHAVEVHWLMFREADAGPTVRSKVRSSNSSTGQGLVLRHEVGALYCFILSVAGVAQQGGFLRTEQTARRRFQIHFAATDNTSHVEQC